MNILKLLAEELSVKLTKVDAAVKLMDEGATVPFIARYRKEATDGLDDGQLRTLEERLLYLRELESRRVTVLKSIEEQGKLDDALKAFILAADTKTRLEDLYAPYKLKRRTKAQIAREAGIAPLLESLLADSGQVPETLAKQYLNEVAGFADETAVLGGARQIFMEQVAEKASLVGELREYVWNNAKMISRVVAGQEQAGNKFSDYFDYQEALKDIPSHRALALFRGRSEGMLRLKYKISGQDDLQSAGAMGYCDNLIAHFFSITNKGAASDAWLTESVRWAWRIKVSLQLEGELNLRLREFAEETAMNVFGDNLRDLLLAAPAGLRVTMGLDPGLRTGVKVVVVDVIGKLVDMAVIYPHVPKNQWDASIAILAKLAEKHKVELISIGNGTASRETDKLAKVLMNKHPELNLTSIVVSEAGASVYSASALAAKEFPDLDVSFRGAVSIARRLQDPLAELVKIEPKSIGVGQYQHDLNQTQLARKLDTIVEDCVNAVGVEVNTASAPLLANVSGLSESVANNIVQFREEHGAFKDRKELLSVPRLGSKAFEQAAGFMRIHNGSNPLDASAVHPEAYPVVERIQKKTRMDIKNLIGEKILLQGLVANDFTDKDFGEPTVRDIIRELEKPGRDPRPEFKTANFKEGVEKIADLQSNMILEGVITNVTNFGAFVDIGVYQDGLVHISNLAEKFVKDPRDVVKAGDVVKVKVMEVDAQRKRVGLSMRLTDDAADVNNPEKEKQAIKAKPKSGKKSRMINKANHQNNKPPANNAMAAAFAKLKS